MIILPQTRGVLHAGKDPYFSSVVFLSHFEELSPPGFPGYVTSTVGSHLSLAGTPPILSTTQVKFGAKSLYMGADVFDHGHTSTSYAAGTSDFTWEGWFYTTSASVYQGILAIGANGSETGQIRVFIYPDGSFVYNYGGVARIQTAASYVSINVWHFWQLRRIGTATELALDGVKAGSTYTDSDNHGANALWVAHSNYPGANDALRGYVDEYRITNGVGRAFGVPSSPFPNS